jgi:N-acetylmuramoyl-L-alanine amidase
MPRSSLKALVPIIPLLGLAMWWVLSPPKNQPTPPVIPDSSPVTVERPALAPLGTIPDWQQLEVFQLSITREQFESLLSDIFTTGEAWRNLISLSETEAVITTDLSKPGSEFHLRFSSSGKESTPPRHWRTASELPAAPADKPLSGLNIAIDPGHIGGEWAKMEERWFSVDGAPPVCEGDLTLKVARLLKPKLEALGASVSMVRNTPEPLTQLRPGDLLNRITSDAGLSGDPRKLAERLFYRTAEIRARADLVNATLKPDLVLCLHFNAEPWGNANTPALVDVTHFHLLLNGGYTDDEVMMEDQRFELLRKLLQRTHEEEVNIGTDVAAAFYSGTGLPPYQYNQESRTARTVAGNPFLWARNLLANRLYDCPVIFLEPYVMNSRGDYARIQAGDYEGLRPILGKEQPSIFREYADALANGLAQHYRKSRPSP